MAHQVLEALNIFALSRKAPDMISCIIPYLFELFYILDEISEDIETAWRLARLFHSVHME